MNGCNKRFRVNIAGKGKADTLNLKIPAGTLDGSKMRLKGQGKPLSNGTNGDLIVEIHVDNDDRFKLDNADVIMDVPVTFCEACFGTKIEIVCPQGDRVRIKIPEACKNGTKLTIKDRGFKKKNGGFGKLIAVINVEVPKKLNSKQKKALKAYEKLEEKEVRKW